MADVARAAGVSRPVVAKVLSGGSGNNSRVSPATALRIRAAATRLRYRPNASARATRSGRFGAVALIMSPQPHRSALPESLLIGIDAALDKLGLRLLVEYVPDEKLISERGMPRLLAELCCDGILLNYHAMVPDQLVALVEKHQLPVVWLNAKRDFDSVYPDDEDAGYRATRRLIAGGHRRIAYLDADYRRAEAAGTLHYSKQDRLAGYRRAMQAAGLTAHEWLPEPGVELIQDLAALARPDSLVSYSAAEIAAAWTVFGAKLPAVTFDHATAHVGFDAFPTMQIPAHRMGQVAAEMLAQKIAAPRKRWPARALRFDEVR
jgi:LacI family transcriptional regulator